MPETVDIIMKIPAMNNVNMRKKLLSRLKFLAKFKDPYKLTSKDDKKRIDNLFHIMRCADKIFSVINHFFIFFMSNLEELPLRPIFWASSAFRATILQFSQKREENKFQHSNTAKYLKHVSITHSQFRKIVFEYFKACWRNFLIRFIY